LHRSPAKGIGGVQRTNPKAGLPKDGSALHCDAEALERLMRSGCSRDIFNAAVMESDSAERGPYRSGGKNPPFFPDKTLLRLVLAFCTKASEEIALADSMMRGTKDGVSAGWAAEKAQLRAEKLKEAREMLAKAVPKDAALALELFIGWYSESARAEEIIPFAGNTLR